MEMFRFQNALWSAIYIVLFAVAVRIIFMIVTLIQNYVQ
jgi:hypothetical protein